jgi:hypothetical protein
MKLNKKQKKLLKSIYKSIEDIILDIEDVEILEDIGLKIDYLIEDNLPYSTNQMYIDIADEDFNFDLYDYTSLLSQISNIILFANNTNIYIQVRIKNDNPIDINEWYDTLIFVFDNTSEFKSKASSILNYIDDNSSEINYVFGLKDESQLRNLIVLFDEFLYFLAKHIQYCDDLIHKLKIKYNSLLIPENTNNYQDEIWFKIGLLFATGEMENLLSKRNYNFTRTAKEEFGYKWTSYRPYISESYNNTTTSNKNIFSNFNKLLKIQEHCQNKNIKITDSFAREISKNNT